MRRKTGFPHCCDDLLGRYGGYKRPRDQQAVCQISGRYGLYSFLWSGKTTNPCPDVQVVMTLMGHLSTIHHVDAGAVSSVQGLAPASLEVHFDPGAKGRRRHGSGLHPSRAPRSAHHSTTGTEEDVAQWDAVEDSAEVALPKHPRSFALEGAGSAGISAGASSSSSSCDGGGRQTRLGRQMGRLWILMQEMMDMAWHGLKHPHVSNTPSIAKNAFTR